MNCIAHARGPSRRPRSAGLLAGQVVLILWVTAGGMCPSLARAQDGMTLTAGKRVRVLDRSLGHEPVVGLVQALRGDTLALLPDHDRFHTLQVVLDRESSVDVSIAHHNYAARGLLIGGGIGAAGGAFVVAFQKGLADVDSQNSVSNGPIIAGAAIGAVAGALIGASITADSWVRVRSPGSTSFGAGFDVDGRPRLVVSASF